LGGGFCGRGGGGGVVGLFGFCWVGVVLGVVLGGVRGGGGGCGVGCGGVLGGGVVWTWGRWWWGYVVTALRAWG